MLGNFSDFKVNNTNDIKIHITLWQSTISQNLTELTDAQKFEKKTRACIYCDTSWSSKSGNTELSYSFILAIPGGTIIFLLHITSYYIIFILY